MVMDALRGYLQLAGGVTEMSRQRATAVARAMLSAPLASPEATRDQVSALAADLMETSRANRDAVTGIVRAEVDRGLGRLGLASAEDVAELGRQVSALESAVQELRNALAELPAPAEPAPTPVRRRSTAARTTAGRPRKAAGGRAAGGRAGAAGGTAEDADTPPAGDAT